MGPSIREKVYIPTLDGWRALAILFVLASHAWYALPMADRVGAVGVQIFFAISGYLICTLLLREAAKGCISLGSFYWRRLFRIFPAALLFLLVVAILSALHIVSTSSSDIVKAALIFANYRTEDRSWSTAHFWSLSMEEHFYLLWPPVLAFLGSRRARTVAILLCPLIVLWRIWAPEIAEVSRLQRTDLRLDAFLLPCILAILLTDEEWRQRLTRFLHPAVCLLLLVSVLAFNVEGRHDAYLRSLSIFYQAAALPLIIVSTVLRPSWLAATLELAPLRWIGRISYSLYLWQQLFLRSNLAPSEIPLRIVLAFSCAVLSYYCIEQPMIRLGRRLWRSSPRSGERASAMSAARETP